MSLQFVNPVKDRVDVYLDRTPVPDVLFIFCSSFVVSFVDEDFKDDTDFLQKLKRTYAVFFYSKG